MSEHNTEVSAATGSSEAHSAHTPHVHQNAWPFVAALGLTLAFFGLIPLTQKSPSGLLFLSMGVLFFLMGVAAWMGTLTREHAAIAKSGAEYENPRRAIWLVGFLILSELFLFGMLFASYFYLRNHDFIYSQTLSHFYMAGDRPMNPMGIIVILNTIFLVTSSFVVHFAEHYLKHGNMRLFQLLLGITILLGATFVGGQVYEFIRFAADDGFTLGSGPYGASFFMLTGLHGLHVSAGVLLLTYLFAGSFFGQFSAKRHVALTVISIYWHFVDVVWILLVGILYLRLL